MKTNARKSSIDAYHSEIIGGKEILQKQSILEYVKKKKRCTGRMIARELGMETGTVSARVNTLVEVDKTLYREISLNSCPISKRGVHWICCHPSQSGLFNQ